MSNGLEKSKESLQKYATWLHQLSWGKFIILIVLILLASSILEEAFFLFSEVNWINTLTSVFILISIGIKALYNPIKEIDK